MSDKCNNFLTFLVYPRVRIMQYTPELISEWVGDFARAVGSLSFIGSKASDQAPIPIELAGVKLPFAPSDSNSRPAKAISTHVRPFRVALNSAIYEQPTFLQATTANVTIVRFRSEDRVFFLDCLRIN